MENKYYVLSPLEQFEIMDLSSISLLNTKFLFTNMNLYIAIILTVIWYYSYFSLNKGKLLPNKWTISQEMIYSTVNNMVRSQIGGEKGGYYFPFIYSLFILIFVLNLTGNIPYSFAVTSHLILTIGLSIAIIIGVTIIGFKIHGKEFFSLFCPAGTPLILVPLLVLIESVSYLARALSLGLRLGANILAGHMLTIILAGFLFDIMSSGILLFMVSLIPYAIVLGIACLELAISAIQAYVFCILTSSYVKDGLNLH